MVDNDSYPILARRSMETYPDCERCDDSGLDPDRYTEQQGSDGTIRYHAVPCVGCQQPVNEGETS
jgi:hypothetical protein